MAVNWSIQVYATQYNVFARPVTIYPIKSGGSTYSARGIYDTVAIDVVAENGSIISDARTILDILESEFSVLPIQGDRLNIPAHNGIPAAGMFEILDTNANGGGELTLQIRKVQTKSP